MKIQTNFRDIDQLLEGGIEKSSLITIGGRPSMGKTVLAISLAEELRMQGKKCLFITRDTSLDEAVSKYKKIKERKNRFKLGLKENNTNIDFICTVEDSDIFESYDFIFLDYLQLFAWGEKSIYEDTSNFMRDLKNLSIENNCCIIILSQLSRKVEERCGKRPKITDLPDSGAIESHSDLVIFLHRKEIYDPLDKPGVADLIIAKNRHGNTGQVSLNFNKDHICFENLMNVKLNSNCEKIDFKEKLANINQDEENGLNGREFQRIIHTFNQMEKFYGKNFILNQERLIELWEEAGIDQGKLEKILPNTFETCQNF